MQLFLSPKNWKANLVAVISVPLTQQNSQTPLCCWTWTLSCHTWKRVNLEIAYVPVAWGAICACPVVGDIQKQSPMIGDQISSIQLRSFRIWKMLWINTKFNLPLMPHFGGVHEVMIKAAKRPLGQFSAMPMSMMKRWPQPSLGWKPSQIPIP